MRVSVAFPTVSVKQITNGGQSPPSETSHERVGESEASARPKKWKTTWTRGSEVPN